MIRTGRSFNVFLLFYCEKKLGTTFQDIWAQKMVQPLGLDGDKCYWIPEMPGETWVNPGIGSNKTSIIPAMPVMKQVSRSISHTDKKSGIFSVQFHTSMIPRRSINILNQFQAFW